MKWQATFLTVVLIFLCACGSSNGSSGDSAQSKKSIFSSWTSSSAKAMDLTGGAFNYAFPLYTVFQSGSVCSSFIFISGSESSGTYSITAAKIFSGEDPGCSALNQSGTYTNDGTTLHACMSNFVCSNYN